MLRRALPALMLLGVVGTSQVAQAQTATPRFERWHALYAGIECEDDHRLETCAQFCGPDDCSKADVPGFKKYTRALTAASDMEPELLQVVEAAKDEPLAAITFLLLTNLKSPALMKLLASKLPSYEHDYETSMLLTDALTSTQAPSWLPALAGAPPASLQTETGIEKLLSVALARGMASPELAYGIVRRHHSLIRSLPIPLALAGAKRRLDERPPLSEKLSLARALARLLRGSGSEARNFLQLFERDPKPRFVLAQESGVLAAQGTSIQALEAWLSMFESEERAWAFAEAHRWRGTELCRFDPRAISVAARSGLLRLLSDDETTPSDWFDKCGDAERASWASWLIEQRDSPLVERGRLLKLLVSPLQVDLLRHFSALSFPDDVPYQAELLSALCREVNDTNAEGIVTLLLDQTARGPVELFKGVTTCPMPRRSAPLEPKRAAVWARQLTARVATLDNERFRLLTLALADFTRRIDGTAQTELNAAVTHYAEAHPEDPLLLLRAQLFVAVGQSFRPRTLDQALRTALALETRATALKESPFGHLGDYLVGALHRTQLREVLLTSLDDSIAALETPPSADVQQQLDRVRADIRSWKPFVWSM